MNTRRNPRATPLAPDERERVLADGIRLFDAGDHWHAHEAWEPLWMDLEGADKLFVQGLIMAAAMLHQHERRVAGGVRNHWANVQARLMPHAPRRQGVDVEGLLARLAPYAADAESGTWRLHARDVRIPRAAPA